jgi:hypothetical protein
MFMSRRSVLAVIAVVALAVAACDTSSPSPSPSASPAPSPDGSPAPTDIAAVALEITAQVEAIRGLEAKEPLAVQVIDEAELAEHQTTAFHEENPPELIEASDGLFTRLGLLEADASLEELYLELLEAQTLGFYDDEAEELFVVSRDGDISALERFTMSHEIDHALQDQAFDLSSVVPDPTNDGDAALGALSLVEGDASLVMVQWATEHLTPAELLEVIEAANNDEQNALLETMPRILSGTLQFPYLAGLQLVTPPQRAEGWSAVDAMFDDPPASTEQVIHPERYEAGDDPIDVTLPEGLVAAMGAGWSLGLEDTFGEYQMSIWLEVGGIEPSVAASAAAGWGGDRMAYLSGPSDENALIWRTAWDRAADAAEFLRAAEAEVEAIGGSGRVVRTSDTEVLVVLASDGFTLDVALEAAGAPSS